MHIIFQILCSLKYYANRMVPVGVIVQEAAPAEPEKVSLKLE